jgi:transcriptional antiterminator
VNETGQDRKPLDERAIALFGLTNAEVIELFGGEEEYREFSELLQARLKSQKKMRSILQLSMPLKLELILLIMKLQGNHCLYRQTKLGWL